MTASALLLIWSNSWDQSPQQFKFVNEWITHRGFPHEHHTSNSKKYITDNTHDFNMHSHGSSGSCCYFICSVPWATLHAVPLFITFIIYYTDTSIFSWNATKQQRWSWGLPPNAHTHYCSLLMCKKLPAHQISYQCNSVFLYTEWVEQIKNYAICRCIIWALHFIWHLYSVKQCAMCDKDCVGSKKSFQYTVFLPKSQHSCQPNKSTTYEKICPFIWQYILRRLQLCDILCGLQLEWQKLNNLFVFKGVPWVIRI